MVALTHESRIVGKLNQLLQLHSRSLPMYLASARPWTPWGHQRQADVLRVIAEDHAERVDQIADYIQDLGGTVVMGEFPMEYTDLHDLSAQYVLRQVNQKQQQDIQQLTQLTQQLRDDPRALALAEEALGAARGHLQSVQECLSPPSHGTV